MQASYDASPESEHAEQTEVKLALTSSSENAGDTDWDGTWNSEIFHDANQLTKYRHYDPPVASPQEDQLEFSSLLNSWSHWPPSSFDDLMDSLHVFPLDNVLDIESLPQELPSFRHASPPLLPSTMVPHTISPRILALDSISSSENAQSNQRTSPKHLQFIPSRAEGLLNVKTTPPSMFRFLSTLHKQTAFAKKSQDIPKTYLNRGQVYKVTIRDTGGHEDPIGPGKYHTCLRIAFDDDDLRKIPSASWKLWKDRRGAQENVEKAVRFVNGSSDANEDPANVQLVQDHFDGFDFQWTGAECTIRLAFNILSTDFIASRGKKGTRLRLYAKTKQLPRPSLMLRLLEQETSYCIIYLFREHGAERKLAHEKTNAAKLIRKLQNQLDETDPDAPSKKRPSKIQCNGKPTKAMKPPNRL